jgi:hypothetical protein
VSDVSRAANETLRPSIGASAAQPASSAPHTIIGVPKSRAAAARCMRSIPRRRRVDSTAACAQALRGSTVSTRTMKACSSAM